MDDSSTYNSAYELGLIFGYVFWGCILLAIVWYYVWVPRWPYRFLDQLKRGDRRRARMQLQRFGKPLGKQHVRDANQPRVRKRMLGLWLLGDLDELRADLARHRGGPTYTTRVEMLGVLALATASDDPAPHVARLEELAATVDASKGMPAGTRDRANLLLRIGKGLTGEPIDEADAKRILDGQYAEEMLTRILLLRALCVAAERTGRGSLRLQKMLAALTPVFTATPPAA